MKDHRKIHKMVSHSYWRTECLRVIVIGWLTPWEKHVRWSNRWKDVTCKQCLKKKRGAK